MNYFCGIGVILHHWQRDGDRERETEGKKTDEHTAHPIFDGFITLDTYNLGQQRKLYDQIRSFSLLANDKTKWTAICENAKIGRVNDISLAYYLT